MVLTKILKDFRSLPVFSAFMAASSALICWTAMTLPARAQAYPDRVIKVIVPFPPGGPTDILARGLGEGFRLRTGQSFVIENKPGANTGIAGMACKASAPDGYTLCFLASTTTSVNPHLYKDLRYSLADLAPVTNIAATRAVLLLNRNIPANNLAELVAWSKVNPDKLNYGSFGVGGETHLMMEWLKKKTGGQITHVPFQGFAPALQAFDRGDIQIMIPVTIPMILDRIRDGSSKAIMILGDSRAENLPDTPAVGDLGLPSIGFGTWFGMFAPVGTPNDRIEMVSAILRAVVQEKSFAEKYLEGGGMVSRVSTPDEFKAFLAQDYQAAGELVKVSGVTIEAQ